MSPYVMGGMFFALAALVLYTLGSIGIFRAKAVARKHVIFLWAGFAADALTTLMMALGNGGKLDLEPGLGLTHTIVGFVVMAGMLAAAIVATRTLTKPATDAPPSIAKWVLAPWAAWVIMFLWSGAVRSAR